MSHCPSVEKFSEYLDGSLTGREMQSVAAHLDSCADCAAEFAQWRAMQQKLAAVGPRKAPADLGLRLRVALSREQARSPRRMLDRWQVRWSNTVRPLALQAAAGLASTVLLVGSVALMIGAMAAPPELQAKDEPLGMASSPRFLYSSFSSIAPGDGQPGEPMVVEAFINREGRVYDYRIISGPQDRHTCAELENTLLFSVFEPARAFGQPVRGVALLSFSGVRVQG